MKKRFLVFLMVLAVPVAVFAAAPTNNSVHKTTASKTAAAAHDATTWTLVDSTIVVKTDTCDTYYMVSGTAVLNPDQRLYVAFKDGAADRSNEKIFELPEGADGPMTIYWGNIYIDSLRSQTDANDTIYVYTACGGSETIEEVALTLIYFTGTVIDKDAE